MKPALALAALLLAGCGTQPEDIGRAPALSAMGSGLVPPAADPMLHAALPKPDRQALLSQADLFRDPRARQRGDVLTVSIAINDRASLGNTSDRTQNAKVSGVFDFIFGGWGISRDAKADASLESDSRASGKGSINRSEKIQLAVAAIVTDVLPNGNLMISGSQEVRVNFELRLLSITGIVRPKDISRDNLIAYDKIAEARISYGGRGRISEVQQPRLIHQIYDSVRPF